MSYLVVWSGGADSTALLDLYAGSSSEDYPVKTISVSRHPWLHDVLMRKQNEAQRNYIKLAKDRGYWVDRHVISIAGKFQYPNKFPAQMSMWMSAVAAVVGDGDTVLFAYIKGDCMWHYKYEFVTAFHAMCALKGVKAKLEFPFEWVRKFKVLDRLKNARIPKRCWWTCESPSKDGKACGVCAKCKALKIAEFERGLSNV